MVDIYYLMELAGKELKKRLPADKCTDDWQWNDSAFQFVILKGIEKTCIVTDPYRFCYDEDEELCGNAEEQLYRWLDRWF